MEYEQENHARRLYRELAAALGPAVPVAVEGAGVHWHCTAIRAERSCQVHCFDVRGPQYLVAFRCGDQIEAWGRTRMKEEVVGAVATWVDGHGIESLRGRFAFVDRRRRALEAIRAEILGTRPALGRLASCSIAQGPSDFCDLWCAAGDRSCRIVFYADNDVPDAAFHWDDCDLLQIQTGDTARLATMLDRWLCDRAMPSAMALDFPEAEIRPVARYYEEGREVEGEFLVSWDEIERFFASLDDEWRFPPLRQALDLIASMRRAGYDKLLRAGQSLFWLILSRSRRHGLRDDQPSVVFRFHENGMDLQVHIDGPNERLSLPRIELSPEVERVLTRLAARGID